MTGARITEIRVEGLRTLADVTLKLDGLTVLIGENGSGKSSLIEACELLHRLSSADFLAEFHNPHGGAFALLRDGAERLCLGATSESAKRQFSYDVRLVRQGSGVRIDAEQIKVRGPDQAQWTSILERKQDQVVSANGVTGTLPSSKLALGLVFSEPVPEVVRTFLESFRSIDVQLPFETLPSWAARAFGRKSEIRGSVLLAPADRLDALGTNLANVYYALREQSDRAYWDDTMDLLRLGLGPEFEEVRSAVDMGGGAHALAVKWRGRDRLMPAAALSDGQIAFLAFVALYRLKRERSLLAIDEPELHLHPGLIARVVQILEAMGEHHPVLVTTHSDRMLDALSNPASSVAVCELESGATKIRRLDPQALASWLADYRGLGDLRSEGHLVDVLAEEP